MAHKEQKNSGHTSRKKRRDLVLANISTKLGEKTPFQIVEAYKTLRTNLMFSIAAAKNKIVVISSALPGEGKSTTCANLAITLAQTESRVLLIDADLRKPTQYKIFKLGNDRGLSRLLVGFDTLLDVLHKGVEPNLDVIASGPQPPNPSELLGSDNMTILLGELCQHYDYILIDTPPINIVSDALVFAHKTAGLVMVTRQGETTYDDFTKAVSSIEFSGSNILGAVITSAHGAHGSYKDYKYRYSYSKT